MEKKSEDKKGYGKGNKWWIEILWRWNVVGKWVEEIGEIKECEYYKKRRIWEDEKKWKK
jgi:hypothetical protein